MPLLRRLTALLSALLLLQLVLLGKSWGCGSPGGSADSVHGAVPASHASHDAAPAHAPVDSCDVERALGGCATMASCVTTTLTAPATLLSVVALVPTSDTLSEPASIHSQPATGPDVPPPRG